MMKIDGREPDSLKFHDWEFDTEVVENMPIGDYVLADKVCIERKEINDLVSSLDNRLWEQMMNMEENYQTNVLFVIGKVADLSSYNMEPRKIEAVYGALARVTLSYDVNVFWFRDRSQFIKKVNKLASKVNTDGSREKPHLERRNFRDDRINVLYGIHGLGHKTIKKMLDVPELSSVAKIAQADVETIAKADGIGEKTATKIYDIMHDGEEENLLS